LTTINVSAPDPPALARFYQHLLGWEVAADEPDWVLLKAPDGGVGATLAGYQPQECVRVYLDPAGHPFCLWVEEYLRET